MEEPVTVELTEEDRQILIQALAIASAEYPTWTDRLLKISPKLGDSNFLLFRSYRDLRMLNKLKP